MPRRDDPADESLPELLDSLEETLTTLRAELGPDSGGPPTPPFGRGRRPPRPPRMRDVLRFTDEYTIPTLVAILEANVRLLRLAQAGIRVLDPERSVLGESDGRDDETSLGGELRRAARDAGRLSADRLASSLSDLQRALDDADTPENPDARDLLTDARALSAEIEQRLRESREQTDLTRFDRRRRERPNRDADATPVRIEVTDGDEADEETGEEDDVDEPDVDVDAELDSIKEEMGRKEERDAGEAATDVPIGGDAEGADGESDGTGDEEDGSDDASDDDYRDDQSALDGS